jgi:hypothetical protein
MRYIADTQGDEGLADDEDKPWLEKMLAHLLIVGRKEGSAQRMKSGYSNNALSNASDTSE